jgi:2-polyprenyl-6-hydroxyphenyl methylase/3-demethylubiquinone-9 3-methyltransferase
MNSPIRTFLDLNVRLSKRFDAVLPRQLSVDGNRDFLDRFVNDYLSEGAVIWDVGGGKQPYLTVERKRNLRCRVTGLDISSTELDNAPAGAYDEKVVADICGFKGTGRADIVICRTLMEHVISTGSAIAAVSTILKPGGVFLAFVPCRNALFARLNLLMPERLKRRVLFFLFPHTKGAQGFPAYYDRCVPSKFLRQCDVENLKCGKIETYYKTSYLSFFFPFYLIWRIWTLLVYVAGWQNYCETFAVAMRKVPNPRTAEND